MATQYLGSLLCDLVLICQVHLAASADFAGLVCFAWHFHGDTFRVPAGLVGFSFHCVVICILQCFSHHIIISPGSRCFNKWLPASPLTAANFPVITPASFGLGHFFLLHRLMWLLGAKPLWHGSASWTVRMYRYALCWTSQEPFLEMCDWDLKRDSDLVSFYVPRPEGPEARVIRSPVFTMWPKKARRRDGKESESVNSGFSVFLRLASSLPWDSTDPFSK